jgi:NADH-quinone oxidoreductase subunit N
LDKAFHFAIPQIAWTAVLPIAIVAVTGMIALIAEMMRPKHNNNLLVGISLGGLALSAVASLLLLEQPSYLTAGDLLARDPFASVMHLLMLLATALSIVFSEDYLRQKRIPFGEFYPLILWSTVGAMIMVATTNLLMIFLGLEILSVSLYVMAGMSRKEEKSEESALKYFLLGAFASGFLLYGIAFVYGATGGLDLNVIGSVWLHHDPTSRTLLIFGLSLMLIGLGFKTSLVPFHQWTPDVYQGAPTNVAAFMATSAKIAAFAALARVLGAFTSLQEIWLPALTTIAILTMFVGNFAALVQKDVKRILGYSSIANAGYLLVAIIAYGKNWNVGFGTIAYFLLSYTLMTVGAFAVVTLMAKNGRESTRLEDLNGMWRRSPFAALMLVVFMASLIGIPPTAGFVGKFLIFFDALRNGLTPLAIVLAVNSIISIYYYMAIARAAFVSDGDQAEASATKPSAAVTGVCAVCAAGIFAAVFFFTPLVGMFNLR